MKVALVVRLANPRSKDEGLSHREDHVVKIRRALDCDCAESPYLVRSCRCLTTDSLTRGYPGQLFGLRYVLELDGERRDS
jgi:hypothetical protein